MGMLHEWHLFDWLKDMNVFFFLINLLTTIKSYSCIILFSYLGLLWYYCIFFYRKIKKVFVKLHNQGV